MSSLAAEVALFRDVVAEFSPLLAFWRFAEVFPGAVLSCADSTDWAGLAQLPGVAEELTVGALVGGAGAVEFGRLLVGPKDVKSLLLDLPRHWIRGEIDHH